jgi:hypothetical protein
MEENNFFSYLNAKKAAQNFQDKNPLTEIAPRNPQSGQDQFDSSARFSNLPGVRSLTQDGEKKGSFPRRLKKISDIGIKGIQRSQAEITQNAADYARFLAGQVGRGQRSPLEASDIYADFGLAYGIPDTFKTAEQLAGLSSGLAPEGTVEQFRPFQTFAAKQLGVDLTEQDIKETEAAARALGKTSPETFSQFLEAKLLTSPDYIRKNPLAFTANLPFGGRYGVGYQTADGGFTGTYRFKPPSSVDYS